ncbi:MAG: hypothetical protein AAF399_19165, partial [Bacteroidota bacterium]
MNASHTSFRQLLSSGWLFFLISIWVVSCQSEVPPSSPVHSESIHAVPEWTQEVIWYQILVERFRNGDPSNDPSREDIDGTYPGFVPDSWQL